MKHILIFHLIYWLCCCNPASASAQSDNADSHADIWKKAEQAAVSSTQTREDQLSRQIEQLRITVENLAEAVERKTRTAAKAPAATGFVWKQVRMSVPCPTCPSGRSYYYAWKQVPASPAPQKTKRYTVRSEPVYYSQWSSYSRWTWPGDLRRHLAGSPHNVSRTWLATATPQQLIAEHSRWHDRNGAR